MIVTGEDLLTNSRVVFLSAIDKEWPSKCEFAAQ